MTKVNFNKVLIIFYWYLLVYPNEASDDVLLRYASDGGNFYFVWHSDEVWLTLRSIDIIQALERCIFKLSHFVDIFRHQHGTRTEGPPKN